MGSLINSLMFKFYQIKGWPNVRIPIATTNQLLGEISNKGFEMIKQGF